MTEFIMRVEVRDYIYAATGQVHNHAKRRRILRGFDKHHRRWVREGKGLGLSRYLESSSPSREPLTAKTLEDVMESLANQYG